MLPLSCRHRRYNADTLAPKQCRTQSETRTSPAFQLVTGLGPAKKGYGTRFADETGEMRPVPRWDDPSSTWVPEARLRDFAGAASPLSACARSSLVEAYSCPTAPRTFATSSVEVRAAAIASISSEKRNHSTCSCTSDHCSFAAAARQFS